MINARANTYSDLVFERLGRMFLAEVQAQEVQQGRMAGLVDDRDVVRDSPEQACTDAHARAHVRVVHVVGANEVSDTCRCSMVYE
jgi:hypothetical protein